MNCKFINVLMFAAGAAIGSAVTWKVVKTKYEKIAQEEIDAVKEEYADRFGDRKAQLNSLEEKLDAIKEQNQIDWDELEDLDEDEDDDLSEYARLVEHYTNTEGGAAGMENKPRVISPYEFGELDGYAQIELTYYADDILEDDEYNIINDRDELIGADSLLTFGEYEDDSVFVRNDRLRADFQILKDYRTYDEAKSVGPTKVDDE